MVYVNIAPFFKNYDIYYGFFSFSISHGIFIQILFRSLMPLSRASQSAKNWKRSKSSGRFTSNKRRKDDDFILEFDWLKYITRMLT